MSDGWIYGDWGSTQLRLWRMRDGRAEEERRGPGIIGLDRAPADVLREAIAPWLADAPAGIRLCGMVGARGGLHEVPYADCPVDAAGWRQASADLTFDGLPLRIAAGLAAADGSGRCEVMRGEETQIFGAVRLQPKLAEGRWTIVHPGTHAKWIDLQGGRIVGFRTYLTGELFALLQGSSLLKVAGDGDGSEDEGFEAGLALGSEQPGLLGNLFQARAAQVRGGRGRDWARGFVSGLLLGNEVGEQRSRGVLGASVLLIGEPALTRRYERALARFDVASEIGDGEACVLAGLELLDADD